MGGTPKWMVYRENPIKMNDFGVPIFQETPISISINLIQLISYIPPPLLIVFVSTLFTPLKTVTSGADASIQETGW